MKLIMIKYKELINVKVIENRETFVVLDKKIILSGYIEPIVDMKKFLKEKVFVRKNVFKRLIKAQKELKIINSSFSLHVSYGYRSLEIQRKLFLKQLRKISRNQFFSKPLDLYEETHKFIAVPEVAGHPTGGAIDLLIREVENNKFLEFGSRIYDFSTNKCEVFNKSISNSAKKNRLLLRKIMMKVGFAPYNGEWWHFSYGDREWAYYYKKNNAIYDQVPINNLFSLINS